MMMRMSVKSPALVLGGAMVIAVAMSVAVWWVLSSPSQVLFDHLDSTQLNSISAELDRAAIAYTIDREKSAIVVAQEDARRARLAVMSSGNALRNTVGFELFDKSDFGMTDFAQKINYQRAIEGEIARTVSALSDIKYSRVHLVLPEHSLFREGQQKPRASITVFLNQNTVLPAERVRGIQRIAAAAVPDLAEQDVTVADQSGVIISATATDDGSAATASARLTQKQALENYLQEKVRRVLVSALGSGHFAVSVDATLDLSQKTTNTEKVLEASPNAGITRLKESSNRRNGENGNDDLLREVEYSVGHQTEQVVHGVGRIERLQIGLIIDSAVRDADPAKLRELVAAAAGIDTARGDKIVVVRSHVAVEKVLADLEAPPPSPVPVENTAYLGLALTFVIGCVLGGFLMWMSHVYQQRRRKEQEQRDLRYELRQWLESDALGVDGQ